MAILVGIPRFQIPIPVVPRCPSLNPGGSGAGGSGAGSGDSRGEGETCNGMQWYGIVSYAFAWYSICKYLNICIYIYTCTYSY